jgi:hypothetical protein
VSGLNKILIVELSAISTHKMVGLSVVSRYRLQECDTAGAHKRTVGRLILSNDRRVGDDRDRVLVYRRKTL